MAEFAEHAVKVPFGTKHLDAAMCFPASDPDVHTAVILTHGAGGDMHFKHLVSLAHALASNGFLCFRFTCKGLNLGYKVKAYRAVWGNALWASMAVEPWNRVNIAFPGAVSSVRIHFCALTDERVSGLLVENALVLKLFRSEILQTEVRVLYKLLYVLNNSSRGNKTFKALKQVEQCVNRLKSMNLDDALQELKDVCPNRIQRGLSITAGSCDVPSQPMLEWLCLKVLGAGRLMSCALNRCSKAFTLSRQHLKWEEFVVLNMVITSMLSRLWVVFRGILVSLSALYQLLLQLLGEVADAHPMPFLGDFSLPADMAQFLGPSDARLLRMKKKAHGRPAKHLKEQQQRREKPSATVSQPREKRNVKEDLGVSIERDISLECDLRPFLKLFTGFTEGKSVAQKTRKDDKKQTFKKQVMAATTFTDMVTHLEEMIPWCKSQKMVKEKQLLTFLLLRCRRMKSLEAAGFNVQSKLRVFRRKACWASSPRRSEPRAGRPSAAMRGLARLRTRFQSLRSRFKSLTLRTGVKTKRTRGQRTRADLSVSGPSEDDRTDGSKCLVTPQAPGWDSHDDIDDIFASVGL
ncbi:nucleolus and neural progenitor protein-like [Spinachia spinachia]